ncbi:hypothetical protein SSS_09742 [Sarcoptes scabiei]|nr:hypothetical protein SSS_09742 [Sarcoptes scabiei]
MDVLNICRSMDKEFTCLINYANKCSDKMTWATFSILKYIITQNNDTIVSCKQKEFDWLGTISNNEDVTMDMVEMDQRSTMIVKNGSIIMVSNITWIGRKKSV